MSFREKTAWAMSIILILAGAFYFNMVSEASAALGETSPPVIGFVIVYVVLVVLASIAAMTVLGIANHKEADAPADEREQRVLDRAGNWAGYILGASVLAGLAYYSVHRNGDMLFHIAFGSLMLSQFSEYVLQIIFYRRGH